MSPPPPPLPLSIRRVLVVEDDTRTARTLAQMLREDGLIVEVVHDGATAIARLSRAPSFDAIVVDYRIPVVDGLTLMAYARKLDPAPHCVMVTSYPEVLARMEPSHDLPFVLITKPLEYHVLARELGIVHAAG